VSYEASPEGGVTVYPLGTAATGVLDYSDTVRVVWERQAE